MSRSLAWNDAPLADAETRRSRKLREWATIGMAVVILLPSMWGFGTKFIEFIAVFRGEADGAFAITPMLNYLLASLGFLCLFAWATLHGIFRDVERPKQTMLDNEWKLDQATLATQGDHRAP